MDRLQTAKNSCVDLVNHESSATESVSPFSKSFRYCAIFFEMREDNGEMELEVLGIIWQNGIVVHKMFVWNCNDMSHLEALFRFRLEQ